LTAMDSRCAMTLTALGLSLRDETLVKSIMNVIGENTHAQWRFVDEIDADLALCDPQSPFARMAMHKSKRSGRPQCVALLYDNASAGPMQQSIRAPLRVGELVALLNDMSSVRLASPAIASSAPAKTPIDADTSRPPQPDRSQWLADVVRELIVASDASRPSAVWRIVIGDFSLDLLLPERRYALSDNEMAIDLLVDIALSAPVDNVIRLDDEQACMSQEMPTSKPVDQLLWRVGLRMTSNPEVPWLQQDIAVRLRRWPDFGRFGAQRAHLTLAALLTKSSWRIEALREASGQTLVELQSFLAACELCGLLEIERVAPAKAVVPVVSRRTGVSGLFRSLRNALGMGA
jgi:hypothetical protein